MADKSPSNPQAMTGTARFSMIDCRSQKPVLTIYQMDNGDLAFHCTQKDPLWIAAFDPECRLDEDEDEDDTIAL